MSVRSNLNLTLDDPGGAAVFVEARARFAVRITRDEECGHWSNQVKGWEESQCFETREEAVQDAVDTVRYAVED